MLLPILLSIAVLAPVAPDADQARLAKLFADGVETIWDATGSWEQPFYTSALGDAPCSIGLAFNASPGGGGTTGYVDWADLRVKVTVQGNTVRLAGVMVETRIPSAKTAHFRFADRRTAANALTSMKRRQAACAPQQAPTSFAPRRP